MIRMRRRHLLLTGLMLPAAALPGASRAQTQDWNRWLAGVRTPARAEGVGRAGLAALDGLRPNDRVIANDRRQAERTLTWEA